MLTGLFVVLIFPATVVGLFPFVKLNPLGAVIAPKLVMALDALFKFKAPALSVAAKVPAVIVPEADCETVPPIEVNVNVPEPTEDAALKLVPLADVINALPLPVVFKERFVAE